MGTEIAHLPFLLRDGRLFAHVARANPIARLALTSSVLALFNGPHGYVSPTWYTEPTAQVPTWNYAVVHARGRARELSRNELLALLRRLTDAFEVQPKAWSLDDLPTAFRDQLAQEIVGLEIEVDRWEAKFKLSQNRSREDASRVADALQESHPTLAEYVARALTDRR